MAISMEHRMHRKLLLLIGTVVMVLLVTSLLTGWLWYARSPSASFRVVARGSSKSSDHIAVSGGNLVVIAPEPGMLFGTVRRPGEEEQFTYLIRFEYGYSVDLESHGTAKKSHCISEGSVVETHDVIELAGKRIEATYRVKLNEARTAVEEESMTIGGRIVDVSLGRVFMIDLSAERPEYLQKKVELPVIGTPLKTPNDVEQLATTMKAILNQHDDNR